MLGHLPFDIANMIHTLTWFLPPNSLVLMVSNAYFHVKKSPWLSNQRSTISKTFDSKSACSLSLFFFLLYNVQVAVQDLALILCLLKAANWWYKFGELVSILACLFKYQLKFTNNHKNSEKTLQSFRGHSVATG